MQLAVTRHRVRIWPLQVPMMTLISFVRVPPRPNQLKTARQRISRTRKTTLPPCEAVPSPADCPRGSRQLRPGREGPGRIC